MKCLLKYIKVTNNYKVKNIQRFFVCTLNKKIVFGFIQVCIWIRTLYLLVKKSFENCPITDLYVEYLLHFSKNNIYRFTIENF